MRKQRAGLVRGFHALACAVLSLAALGGSAHAMRCTMVNASGVRFGGYDTLSGASLDSAGLLSFQCADVAPGDAVRIQISRGGSSAYIPRVMTRGDYRLEYNLFRDAGRTAVWGDGTGGTSVYTGRPTEGELVSLTIFGRVPPRQKVAIGSYTDTVTVTILY